MLQWLGSYAPLFVFAGFMHPLAWLLVRWLVRGELKQISIADDKTLASGTLRYFGLGLLAGGLLTTALVVVSWGAILEATRHSVAAAAGGVAAALLVGLIGAALIYASRAQPVRALRA
jgi:hypothetical protein